MRNPALKVNLSFEAQDELLNIWQYNARRDGTTRADRYDDFLRKGIDKLATNHKFAKVVEVMPELRYVTLKRRSKGDGHVIVFSVGSAIDVLHVFHTKQDWPNKL